MFPLPPVCPHQRLDVSGRIRPAAPSVDHSWYGGLQTQVFVTLPEGRVMAVPVAEDCLVSELLAVVCEVCVCCRVSSLKHQKKQNTFQNPRLIYYIILGQGSVNEEKRLSVDEESMYFCCFEFPRWEFLNMLGNQGRYC